MVFNMQLTFYSIIFTPTWWLDLHTFCLRYVTDCSRTTTRCSAERVHLVYSISSKNRKNCLQHFCSTQLKCMDAAAAVECALDNMIGIHINFLAASFAGCRHDVISVCDAVEFWMNSNGVWTTTVSPAWRIFPSHHRCCRRHSCLLFVMHAE